MATKSIDNPPLIVIVGETASGKSSLAMEIAKKYKGEIICADSRTIYKYMDVSTAKPSKSDQEQIPHHLLNIIDPDKSYNISMFKEDTLKAIEEINNRDKLPIMVGGSGLYIDSVIYDYQFESANDRNELRNNTLVIGMQSDREVLKKRIEQRADSMIADGIVDEIREVSETFGWDIDVLRGIGYQAIRDYIEGNIAIDEMKARIIKSDLALAKKQRTWFKRNKSIQWVDSHSKALNFVQQFLNK